MPYLWCMPVPSMMASLVQTLNNCPQNRYQLPFPFSLPLPGSCFSSISASVLLISFFFLIYLLLAALGLRYCARAFSSCCEQGPLLTAVRGPLISVASLVAEYRLQAHRLQQLWHTGPAVWLAGSRAQAQQLQSTGLVALRHVGSSQTTARTRVPCIGRRILNHCTTREVPRSYLYFLFKRSPLSWILWERGDTASLLPPGDGILCYHLSFH